LLLVAMLALHWYRGSHGSLNGWNGMTHLRWVLVLTAGLALLTGLTQATRRSPAIPVTLTLFAGLAGLVSLVVLIYRFLADPPGGSRQAGGFLALVAVVAIVYGAWQSLRSDRVPDVDAPSDIPVITSLQTSGVGPSGARDS
jgi:hypothetical protein